MHTASKTNNERLHELVKGAGLTQPAALAIFNKGFGMRGIKDSTWRGYFCRKGTTRYRTFNDDFLKRAEKVFLPLQIPGEKSSGTSIVNSVHAHYNGGT